MRVGILALQHESNTFIRWPTTKEMFAQEVLLMGPAIREEFSAAHHEIGGFFEGLSERNVQAVPIFAARALPAGIITAQTCQDLLTMLLASLDRTGPLDGLLVAPHGAAVSEDHPDLDGHWLSLVRNKVGPKLPIVCTLDPHANLSPRMIEACNATIAYRSNPHLDQRQRGVEAASLLVNTLRGRIKPTQAATYPPIAINIERQETSKAPCKPMYDLAQQMANRPEVLSHSILLGFPYADVKEMGSAFIFVTNDDQALAQKLADQLTQHLWDHRQDFVGQLINIERAIDGATVAEGPVCLLDMGDNVGGGSPADSTILAHAIHHRKGPRSFVCINDPGAVEVATQAGIGRRARLNVGGKTDDLHGLPLEAEFTVRSLHEGRFTESKPRHGGHTTYHMGKTAIVESVDGLSVQLTSKRTPPLSLNQITCCGLDPASFQILVAKGVIAPVAAYSEVCREFIRANTPGVTTADMTTLSYQHRRRPLFPFEEPRPI